MAGAGLSLSKPVRQASLPVPCQGRSGRWTGRKACPALALVVALMADATGCVLVGERYQLLPAPARLSEPQPVPIERLIFSDRVVSALQFNLAEFVFAEIPVGSVLYGAWNSCSTDRDEMFYEGFRRDGALELQPLGRYPEVRAYCGFSLATDGDTILVFGGGTRPQSGFFRPRLHSQLLVLDPERGTARRLSPPRGFTRRLSRVFFDPQVGSYILKDHRGAAYRLRLP